MRNIFLIGYMGAGKTTIGKQLAKRLEWPFVDTDSFIENRYHQKVSELFAGKGEEAFREIEHAILQEVAQFEKTVISTGGGTPCFFDNMNLMNRAGTTIYLKVSVDELTVRLISGKQERPLIKGKKREELKNFIDVNLDKRENWYNQAAIIFSTEQLQTQQNVDVIVENLINRISEQKT